MDSLPVSSARRRFESKRRPDGRSLLGVVALALVLPSCAHRGPERDTPDFSAARSVLQHAVQQGAFPGCAVAVGDSRGEIWIDAFGALDRSGQEPVTADTVYDLASLTKVIGTTTVLVALVHDGMLDLESPLGEVLDRLALEPGADDPLRAQPLHALLSHTSGLPAWRPFYRTVDTCDALVRSVLAEPLEHAPGEYHYSDLGFILLGAIAERAGGAPLAELERRLVFAPLAMADTTRSPAPPHDRVAPTEEILDESGEPHVLRGVVHDENARAAGGRTGHAGLFSTAPDISRFATALLRAARGAKGAIDPQVLARFLEGSAAGREHGRAFGWQLAREGRSSGRLLSDRAFGHTGFTGTSLWIDPGRDLYFALLSNRVHPSRKNRKIAAVRRDFADAVVVAVDAWRDRSSGSARE